MRVRVFNSSLMDGEGAISVGSYVAQAPVYMMRPATEDDEVVQMQYIQNKASVLDVSSFTTGTLSLSRIPAFGGQVNKTAGTPFVRINLPTQLTQPSQFVKKGYVNEYGYITDSAELSASDIPAQSWSKVQNLPTTREGYGITDLLGVSGGTISGNVTIDMPPAAVVYSSDYQTVTKAYVDAKAAASTPAAGPIYAIGDIRLTASPVAPTNFFRCNGALVNVSGSELFEVIGHNYSKNTLPGAGRPWEQQAEINYRQDVIKITTSSYSGRNLPQAVSGHQLAVMGNKIYCIGGVNETGTPVTNVARTSASDDYAAWEAGVALSSGVTEHQVVTSGGRVFLIGGYSGGETKSTVLTADYSPLTGLLGGWVERLALPEPRRGGRAFIIGNTLYYVGGRDNGNVVSNKVFISAVTESGHVVGWSEAESLPAGLRDMSLIVTSKYVYLIGGYDANGLFGGCYRAEIQPNSTIGTGNLFTWQNQGFNISGYIGYRARAGVRVTSTRAWIYGGISEFATGLTSVISAPIDPNTGILQTTSWSVDSAYLPYALYDHQVATLSNSVIVVGGLKSNGTLHNGTETYAHGGGKDSYFHLKTGGQYPDSTKFQLPDLTTLEEKGIYAWICHTE